MPNKTIYVRDADVPLFEKATPELGESISALFASFLRDRVATMTVQEKQVVQLINRIKQDRERLAVEDIKEASTELDQAEDYARKCLEAVQKRNYRTARGLYDASDSLRELALQTLQTYKQILAAITSATPVR
jgi:hypothetical protein